VKEYPSIQSEQVLSHDVIVFDKLDGSNVRAEWTRKQGFCKFGRRNGLLDDSNPHLLAAPKLIEEKYGYKLGEIFKKERFDKVTCFFELHGPNSFAGTHDDKDMTVTLIDIAIHPKGFVSPQVFLKLFQGKVDIPKILHKGRWGKELTELVNSGKLEGMTFEGVVCKGPEITPGRPLMFKVKNHEWYKKLKERCGDNEKLFEAMK
jgi:hypothetical protein